MPKRPEPEIPAASADAGAPTREVRVLSVGELRALAHPLRIEIYDILSQFGPQTASSLGEQLGESSGVTSYHLRALAKHDLIREVPERGTARERWWERPRGTVSMSNPDAAKTPAGRAATEIVTSEFYRKRHEQLMQFISASMHSDEDEEPGLLTTASARLTREQFDDLSSRIEALIGETVQAYRDQRGEGVRLYTIRADVFPLIEPGVSR
ncbi:winged helix-turn-helix domain-containing protein [Microbacterium lacus]|uniref:winged helix-turn-helix domain-containing protein n=1 Tax=Microbacterium lacus TaxID=415217 RepID=UPI000C2BC340|nr:helix-turn-helix domain-containing protein [Microbacterium lacus]